MTTSFNLSNLFVGKVCTILTTPINREFNEEANVNYFVGRVIEVSPKGVLIEHLGTKNKSFFFTDKIVGIAEEQTLAHNPNIEKPEIVEPKNPTDLYNDIDQLSNFKFD